MVTKVKPAVSGPDSVSAVRELFLIHIDAALKRLRPGRPLTDKDVHEARKSIRRTRAMLKWLRPSLDAGDFSSCKIELRKAGRALSAPRDARVIADRFTEMLDRIDLPDDSFGATAIELRGGATSFSNSAAGRHRAASAARTSLTAARQQLTRASLHGKGWAALGAGARSIYTRGRQLMPRKLESASAEDLHEWRKQVKSHWYVMEVFMPLRPTRIGRSVRDARRLAGLLGEDHDLELLAGKLRAVGDSAELPARALLEAINSRQKRLRRRALRIGAALYGEPAVAMGKSLRRDWRKWMATRPRTSSSPVQ